MQLSLPRSSFRSRMRLARRLTDPLARIPVLGDFLRVFYLLVLVEGDPRSGIIFSYLNDGIRPTLWHTAIQVTRRDGDPHVGKWPGGAPRSRAEADEFDRQREDVALEADAIELLRDYHGQSRDEA